MSIFKRKGDYTSLTCPECGEHLDYNKEAGTARCKYCNAEFIIDAPSARKSNMLETVFDFVERQQDRYEQNAEKRRLAEEHEAARRRAAAKKRNIILGVIVTVALIAYALIILL